jgi:hypothetical protein
VVQEKSKKYNEFFLWGGGGALMEGFSRTQTKGVQKKQSSDFGKKRKTLMGVRIAVVATMMVAVTFLVAGIRQFLFHSADAATSGCSSGAQAYCVYDVERNSSTAIGGTEVFIYGSHLTDISEAPYIDMNRDAAFDLGLPLNQNSAVEVVFRADPSTENQVLFGAREGLYATSYDLIWQVDVEQRIRFDYGNPTGSPNTNLYYMGGTITNTDLVFVKNGTTAAVSDPTYTSTYTSKSNLPSAPFTTPTNALLGSANGINGFFDGRVYGMLVWENNFQRWLVPVKSQQNIDGKVAPKDGFYDIISRSFLNNTADGSPVYVAGGQPASTRVITIGGEACANLKIVGQNTLSCEVPAYQGTLTADTTVDINLDINGEQLTLTDGFTYKMTADPNDDGETLVVESITENQATNYGGTVITIKGQGLTDPSADDPYLSLDRNAAFDLGFPLTEKHDVEVVFWSDAPDNQIVFGAREGLNKVSYNLMWALGDGTIRFDYGPNGSQFIKTPTVQNQIIKFAKTGNKLYINGNEVVSNLPTGAFTTPSNALIASATGASGYFDGRIYSFKVWENGALLRDLIPVYRGQEIDGKRVVSDTLYDKVSQEFLYNILMVTPNYIFTEKMIPTREVTIDGKRCTDLKAVAHNTLTCITPAYDGELAVAMVDVVVEVNGQIERLENGFTYVSPAEDSWALKIDRVEVDKGSKDGGNEVSIYGDGFMKGASVHFDGSSWTDLGLQLTDNHNVQICLQFDNEDDLTIFGARTSGGLLEWDGNAFNAYTLLRPEDTMGKIRLYYDSAVNIGHSGYIDFGGRDLDWHTIGKFGRSLLYDNVIVDRTLPVDYFVTPVNAYLGTFSDNGNIQTDALIGSVSCLDVYDNATQVMKLRPVTTGMVIDGAEAEADGFYDYINNAFYYNEGYGELTFSPADTTMSATIDGQECTDLRIINNTKLECVVPAYSGAEVGDVPVMVGLTLFDRDGAPVNVASKQNGYTYLSKELAEDDEEEEVLLEVPDTGKERFGDGKAKSDAVQMILAAMGAMAASGILWVWFEKRFGRGNR